MKGESQMPLSIQMIAIKQISCFWVSEKDANAIAGFAPSSRKRGYLAN
jgi:hypothetical protein